jgi:aspartate/methionine/tyrosine aminotransferase
MAKHLTKYFKPAEAIDAEQITFAAGVTQLIEACALLLCNADEDAIMLGRPVYGTFSKNLAMRTG